MILENGLIHSRKWREKVIGKETTNAIFDFCERFNKLQLKDSEIAILLPLIMTKYGIDFIFKTVNNPFYKLIL